MLFSGIRWSSLKEVKPLVVWDWERWVPLDPIQFIGPRLELIWYMELFRISAVTSGFL